MKTLSHWRFVTLLTTLITLLSFLVSMPAWASAQTASASPHTAPSIARVAGPANTAVLTYKNDTLHSGLNSHETILTPGNVNGSQFGKRVSYPVDGQVYAQPLYMPGLTVGGNTFNAVFVATENDTLYAFDADQTDSSAAPLWKASFLRAGETAVSQNDVSCNNIDPLIGITSTPVIDPQTHTLYAVGFSRQSNGSLVYRLHAINITTGLEEAGSPITISGIAAFANNHERQRANLLLANGKVYMAFASFCDNAPYHGFVLSYTYNGSAFHLANVYNDTPNGHLGGIWGGAGALAADNSGNIYVMTGNGTFDLNTGGHDAGDSFVRLNSNLTQADYFAPFNQACLEAADGDLGSGGPLILQGSNYTELIGAGKEGRVYVLNANSMGHFRSIANPCGNASGSNDTNIKQELPQHYVGGAFSTPTTWSSATTRYVYISGVKDHIKAFKVNSNGTLVTPPASQSLEIMGHQGGNPVVSSNGTANGILWVTDGSGLLRAYDATNLAHALFTGFLGGNYVKFSNPMVANGEVFVGTSSTLDIFGEVSSPPGVYNNKGISDDSNRGGANFDSVGHSYSAQALASVGVTPGHPVIVNGFSFQWPNVQPGTPDNWLADGQTLPVTSVNNASVLGILGAADFGAASGTATMHFTDGTSQTFTLGFTDWWQPPTVSFNNVVARVAPYQNASTGKVSHTATLYLAQVSIPTGEVIQGVTLPSSIIGGQLHVFALSTENSSNANTFNNAGISNDTATNVGNFDGGGRSYSAQALASVGVTPGNSVTVNGFTFQWPNVQPGTPDNWQADGQTLPVTSVNGATTLGILGAADFGEASGTATVHFSDGTSQTFTLGFTDWWQPPTVFFNNMVAAVAPYQNAPTGKVSHTATLYLAQFTIPAGKVVQSVTLPSSITGGQLHVFSTSTK